VSEKSDKTSKTVTEPRTMVGNPWEGYACYSTDPQIGRPGYYALEDDGKTIREPHVMLTWVDEAPGDDDDGSGHYEVANMDVAYHIQLPPSLNPNTVDLEATVVTKSELSAGGEPGDE